MISVYPDAVALTEAAATMFVQIAKEAVAKNGRFLVALSGGSTPLALFRRLAQLPDMPWAKTHIFWGDERLVPPDDPGSNYKQAYEALLQHVPVPPQQIHRALGEVGPSDAAIDYANQLQQLAEPGGLWPRFDLILLGLGSDGHTASLFPGPIPPEAALKPIIAVTADYDGRPAHRITFTPPVINDARHILFLVVGEKKRAALTAVRTAPHNPEKWPAQHIHPHNGTITWLADTAAAPDA
ncbi:MAG: 6-phosphogluconolactonase [Anaerolineales bacterium]|nr:6-phosphogluconolactonase [Anaerolineales bacterium]